MTTRNRIVVPFRQEQPDDVESFVIRMMGARTEDKDVGMIECGCVIVEDGIITETHWFKVLQS